MLHRDSGIGKPLIVAILGLLISPAEFALPQQVNPSARPSDYTISVNVGLVVLPVIVTNKKGVAISGLEKDNFQVLDNGHPQQIALFEPEDVPVTVGLVVDNSGSMTANRPAVVAAARQFAASSNPQDQMFVVNFNGRVHLGLPPGMAFTSDVHLLQNALTSVPASGNTALYDAIATALAHLQEGTTARKALIVVSDGGDDASKLSLHDVLKRAQASNAQIYTIGVFSENYSEENPDVLRHLAKATGGKAYFPDAASQIPAECEEIANDLRHQYTIGYRPSDDTAGKYHEVHVTAKNSQDRKLRVQTRAGYLMSGEPPAAAVAGTQSSL